MAESSRPDPYVVLGIARGAPEDDVRAAYRRLVRSEHPDTGGSHDRFIMVTWAYELLTDPQKRAAFDTGRTTWDWDQPNRDVHETDGDLGPSRPVPSCDVLEFGTLSAGGSSRALRFDVLYDAEPPEVDYQPRFGAWWTTTAVAIDDPLVAVQIEVAVAVPANTPSGTLRDRIVVTFDDAHSAEVELHGKVVGKPVTATRPSPPVAVSTAAVRTPDRAASPVATRRHRPSRAGPEASFRRRVAMSIVWLACGLSCVALVFALAFEYALPTSELPNVLWLQFISIPLCVIFLGVAVFAVLPWTIVRAVRLWRPANQAVRVSS